MNHQEIQLNAMTLGEMATKIPGATAVFRRYDLDFCCAGNQKIADALVHKGLSQKDVFGELEELVRHSDGVTTEEPGIGTDDAELIDYIIARFHEVHRQQFPELIRLSTRVEQVHAANALCPKGLQMHLTAMFTDLSAHMEKEEKILFPMLRNGDRERAAGWNFFQKDLYKKKIGIKRCIQNTT